MTEPEVRADGLQLAEDRVFQERQWTVERIAQGVFGLVVGLALLGFLGAGRPLARVCVETEAGSLVYGRVLRWDNLETVRVRFATARPVHRLIFGPPFTRRFRLETVEPAPARSFADPRGLVLEFDAAGAPGAEVVLVLRTTAPGPVRFAVRIDDAAPVTVTELVLP